MEESIYIPKDLGECFIELEKQWSKDDVEVFKNRMEEDLPLYHFNVGMWIRNNWGLWGNSDLAEFFRNGGIFHADDMSAIVLTSFHRYLNKRDIKIVEQVEYFWQYWDKTPGDVSDWDRKSLVVLERLRCKMRPCGESPNEK